MLGVVDEKTVKKNTDNASTPSSSDTETAIAAIARQHGGDAVIIVDGGPVPSRQSEDGQPQQRLKKLMVIKYVD